MKPSASTRRISGVAVIGGSGGQPQLAFQIEDPARHAIGVLAHQRLSRRSEIFSLVKVVPGFVTVVEADVKDVRVVLRDFVESARGRLRARSGRARVELRRPPRAARRDRRHRR